MKEKEGDINAKTMKKRNTTQDNDMTLDQDEDCLLINIEVHKYN